jgi:hypothetical protein
MLAMLEVLVHEVGEVSGNDRGSLLLIFDVCHKLVHTAWFHVLLRGVYGLDEALVFPWSQHCALLATKHCCCGFCLAGLLTFMVWNLLAQ